MTDKKDILIAELQREIRALRSRLPFPDPMSDLGSDLMAIDELLRCEAQMQISGDYNGGHMVHIRLQAKRGGVWLDCVGPNLGAALSTTRQAATKLKGENPWSF